MSRQPHSSPLQKDKRREQQIYATRAESTTGPLAYRLEVELERELNDSSSMFIYDLAKVVFRGLIKLISLERIANACRASRCIWNGDGSTRDALGVERQIDIALAETTRRRNLAGIRLVEDVEEAGSELELLGLAKVEILEERNVKVAPAGRPQVEGWLRRAGVRELRNSNGVKVKVLLTNLATTRQWIL